MSVFFYNVFLWLFRAGTHIASLFNPKAKKWVQGRKGIWEKLEQTIPRGEKIIWMHCASLGEFEQGRPLLEQLRNKYPRYKILLTFFSPSGYEVQKNYPGANWVFYLPLDGPTTAKRFLEIVHPSLVIFVKYEFWFYYLKKIKYRNIPLILVSALFRKDMSFFKWYGKLQRKMLSRFDHVFVQNRSSQKLVEEIGLGHICSVSGDTRFDRVLGIAALAKPIPEIAKFIAGNPTIILGSTWPEDEEIFQKAFFAMNDLSIKLIIAPHEISEKHIASIKKLFPDSVCFSELALHDGRLTTTLIIDNIGMLSRLYQHANICYVGGGMKKNGVHNVLEAAVWYKPVLFGPYYNKYTEAVGLVETGGGLSFDENGEKLKDHMVKLLSDKEEYIKRSKAAGEFVRSNKGAAEKILQFIQEKRLLTN